jgi:hypothetical protein
MSQNIVGKSENRHCYVAKYWYVGEIHAVLTHNVQYATL